MYGSEQAEVYDLIHRDQKDYAAGVEVSAPMLAQARRKLPDVPLHQGDMRDFDLGAGSTRCAACSARSGTWPVSKS